MERLKGKTAMVVGAGSIGPGWGNGKATAATFAREGAQVFCVDRNAAAAKETVDIITGEGGKAIAFTADVSREAEVEAMVAACLKAYGRIDVLDNNVGIAEMGNVVEVNEASWDHVFAVNLKSAYFAMKHVIPVMAEAGRRLDHQHLLDRLDPPSRHFLRHLRRLQGGDEPDDAHHRRAFARNHVRVNCILPGLMKTPMVAHSAGLAAELFGRRCRGDVAGARRAGADGAHGRRLGRRQCGAVSGVR